MREGGGERPGESVSSEAGYPASIYIYTIVACAFKWKSSAARSAFNLTAETQGLSSKVHSIGTTEPIRPGGTSAQTSRFISISSEVC